MSLNFTNACAFFEPAYVQDRLPIGLDSFLKKLTINLLFPDSTHYRSGCCCGPNGHDPLCGYSRPIP